MGLSPYEQLRLLRAAHKPTLKRSVSTTSSAAPRYPVSVMALSLYWEWCTQLQKSLPDDVRIPQTIKRLLEGFDLARRRLLFYVRA
jgi:hypothetical protein